MANHERSFQPNAAAPSETLASLRAGMNRPLPESHFAFLQKHNGGEGLIGDRYVQLWKAEELLEMNRAYKASEFFPNLFFIGSNGGGEAYAFDLSRKDATVFEVHSLGCRLMQAQLPIRSVLLMGTEPRSMSEIACSR